MCKMTRRGGSNMGREETMRAAAENAWYPQKHDT